MCFSLLTFLHYITTSKNKPKKKNQIPNPTHIVGCHFIWGLMHLTLLSSGRFHADENGWFQGLFTQCISTFFFFFILPFVPGSPVSWRLFWLLLPQLPFPSPSAEGLQELHPATVARRREAQPVKWRLHKFISVEIWFNISHLVEQAWHRVTVKLLAGNSWTQAQMCPGGQEAKDTWPGSGIMCPVGPEQWTSPVQSTVEAIPWVQCPVLGPSWQDRHWRAAACPEKESVLGKGLEHRSSWGV